MVLSTIENIWRACTANHITVRTSFSQVAKRIKNNIIETETLGNYEQDVLNHDMFCEEVPTSRWLM